MEDIKGHKIEIVDRSDTKITGVKKLESFNDHEFSFDSVYGPMKVTGKGLELGKMDLDNGILTIKGTVESLRYTDKNKANDDAPFWKKVFR